MPKSPTTKASKAKTTPNPRQVSTPIKLPNPLTAEALAMHIESLAKKIVSALNERGHNSVTVGDKKDILSYTKDIIDATSSIRVVMDAQTVVSNISATDLISSVKEELRQFKEDITQQINATPTSYSEAAAKPKKIIKTPVSRPAIVIASGDANHKHSDVLDIWRNKVSFKDANYAPVRTQHLSKNKLRVEFENEKQRDATLQKLKNVPDLKSEEAKRLRPMMILKGVSTSVDSKELVDILKRQNPSVNTESEKDMRLCFLRNNRNANLFNAVIEVTPKIRNSLLEIGRVNIDHQRVHISDFSPFIQCYKCLQFGHTKAKCDPDITRCSHCASTEHCFKDCDVKEDSKKLKCYNCHTHNAKTEGSVNDAHSATSAKYCSRVKAIMKRITERVDYGC